MFQLSWKNIDGKSRSVSAPKLIAAAGQVGQVGSPATAPVPAPA